MKLSWKRPGLGELEQTLDLKEVLVEHGEKRVSLDLFLSGIVERLASVEGRCKRLHDRSVILETDVIDLQKAQVSGMTGAHS